MTADIPAIPFDVRLMNGTAATLFVLFTLMAIAALAAWAANHGLFAISAVTVSGDITHNNAVTLRANVVPRMAGSFLTIDLARTRTAFESVPWVRRAIVRREFPNRLKVVLQEHRAVAYWGPEGDSRLLNSYGEVFEANAGEVEHEALPRLSGPAGQEPQVLNLYQLLAPQFEALDLSLEQLELSGRGSWIAHLDTGAVIELGRGTDTELQARTARFLKTLTQVTSRYQRRPDAVETADLRHAGGYALRLRGVSTGGTDTKKK
ncbi:MAG: cell division protein FtsQ/DivIB [Burkholderiaceae bacterium]